MPSGICWNLKIAYDTAAFVGPSGCHEISLTLLLATSHLSLLEWRVDHALLKQHQRLGAQVLDVVLTFFILKVFLKQVDLVVLRDAFLHRRRKLLYGTGK